MNFNFKNLVTNAFNGETPEQSVEKFIKSAALTFKAQYANKEAETAELENAIEEAQQNILVVLGNSGESIKTKDDRDEYFQKWIDAETELERAKQKLENHNLWLAKIKNILDKIEDKKSVEETVEETPKSTPTTRKTVKK